MAEGLGSWLRAFTEPSTGNKVDSTRDKQRESALDEIKADKDKRESTKDKPSA